MSGLNRSVQAWLTRLLGSPISINKHTFSNQDDVYVVRVADARYFLKVAASLEIERINIERIQPYLPVPKVIGFCRIDKLDHLLMSEVPGKNLAELVGEWTDTDLVKEFATAVRMFHKLDPGKLYPENTESDVFVLHGDMSMPNVLCTMPGSVGYIDLAQVRLGTPDIDLADAIWSLQRNMGHGYGKLFLQEYGDVVMTERLQKALDYRYEN